jgi:hypothetical protein
MATEKSDQEYDNHSGLVKVKTLSFLVLATLMPIMVLVNSLGLVPQLP